MWYPLLRLIRNVYFDIRYQGKFLGGSVKSRHAHLGAYDVQNSDYTVLPLLFYHSVFDGRWRRGHGIHVPEKIVDVGCGRGRVINWLLSQKCTCQIVGVELERSIAESTGKRLARYSNVQIICGNILENIPGDATLFYMYNPFDIHVVLQFKTELERMFGDRGTTVIYNNACHLDVFRYSPTWNVFEVPISGQQMHRYGWHRSVIVQLPSVDQSPRLPEI